MYVDPSGHSWESFWSGIGNWFADNWVKLAIGAAFIVGGAIISALTCGVGATAWAAFGSTLLSSLIQTGASVAISVGVNGIVNIANGNDFFDNVGDTIASSFMLGGILSGGSQILSGGARFLRAKVGFKGINGTYFGFMSPDKLFYKRAGMTIFRIGSKKGIKLAVDLGRYGIHAHLISNRHIPFIPLIVGLIEAF